jgi:hypothetical protein
MTKLKKKIEGVKWKDRHTLYWPGLRCKIYNSNNEHEHNELS